MAPGSEYVTGRWVTYTTGDWTAGARPNRRTHNVAVWAVGRWVALQALDIGRHRSRRPARPAGNPAGRPPTRIRPAARPGSRRVNSLCAQCHRIEYNNQTNRRRWAFRVEELLSMLIQEAEMQDKEGR